MSVESRRNFLAATGSLLMGTALGSTVARAAEEHMHGGSGDGLAVDAGLTDVCATCQFWGGMRRVSDDGANVVAQSMGWCNNPDSPNKGNLTAADHRMNKTGIWKKWAVL